MQKKIGLALVTKLVLATVSAPANAVTLEGQALTPTHQYSANWPSLDSRPLPQWFSQAKFGIFIHWGPYSVPAYSPKGTYAEWYQYWLQERKLSGNGEFSGAEIPDYHAKTFGEQTSYYDLAQHFTADLFEPDTWAELFSQAGARYVVLTTKHHDGFALWPSQEANSRGFAWNSLEVGAKRDLVGEFSQAIRKTDLKLGLYYSLYEWYHPFWQDKSKRGAFVDQHFYPQFKDLVQRFEPDLIWADGQWSMSSAEWKTPELLTWLYNESPVADKVVVNDRWGKETYKKHGGFLTTEYESGGLHRVWEECRGMGFSFGYNQNEDIEDYTSTRALVLTLIDIVSHGGNLLLDVGPDARGNIPVIMQERLLQIGKWLKVNGEAIYATRGWHTPVQWSEGDRGYKSDERYVSGEHILKLTVDPEPGYASKEVFFTQNDEALFAITPRWPGKTLLIKGLNLSVNGQVTLLAGNRALSWRNAGDNLEVALPEFDPEQFQPEHMYAYAFKVRGVLQANNQH